MLGVTILKTKKMRRLLLTVAILAIGYLGGRNNILQDITQKIPALTQSTTQQAQVSPDYQAIANRDFENGSAAYLAINNDKSQLTSADWTSEKTDYGQLDQLNRTTSATAYLSSRNLGKSEGRSRQVWNPTGWHNQPLVVNGRRITPQNRGHLIAYTISFNFDQNGHFQSGQPGSLDNPLNLATQTEYSNQKTMQIFEEKVRNALAANKKVIYKVTTVFRGNELMPRGYWVQAISTDGTLNFNDYVWNIEPGVAFDYATGRSHLDANIQVKDNHPIVKGTENTVNNIKNRF